MISVLLSLFSLVETFPYNYYRELDRSSMLTHAAAASTSSNHHHHHHHNRLMHLAGGGERGDVGGNSHNLFDGVGDGDGEGEEEDDNLSDVPSDAPGVCL